MGEGYRGMKEVPWPDEVPLGSRSRKPFTMTKTTIAASALFLTACTPPLDPGGDDSSATETSSGGVSSSSEEGSQGEPSEPSSSESSGSGSTATSGTVMGTESGTSSGVSSSEETSGETSVCGDGDVEGGEECDPGPYQASSCNQDCTLSKCGDGKENPKSEDCDDGNTQNGDGCSSTCKIEEESGSTSSGEESGDSSSGDSEDLTSGDVPEPDPICGNGLLEMWEQCDDGNAIDTDICLSTCKWASCGDGFVWAEGGEDCDDQNQTALDGCEWDCKATPNGECGIVKPDDLWISFNWHQAPAANLPVVSFSSQWTLAQWTPTNYPAPFSLIKETTLGSIMGVSGMLARINDGYVQVVFSLGGLDSYGKALVCLDGVADSEEPVEFRITTMDCPNPPPIKDWLEPGPLVVFQGDLGGCLTAGSAFQVVTVTPSGGSEKLAMQRIRFIFRDPLPVN